MEKKKRVRNTKPGDVFAVKIDKKYKKFMQYVVSDMSQLNSDVIRAFKKIYPIDSNPDLTEIVIDEVDFYAHCCTRAGLKQGLWEFVGTSTDIENIDFVIFRSAIDLERIKPQISHNWWIWSINGERKYVGKLPKKYWSAHIGPVFPPFEIVDRIKNGKWTYGYPGYE